LIGLEPVIVAQLPVDELGLHVLQDMIDSGTWNDRSYYLEARQDAGYSGAALRAIEEAIGWLHARGLIAHSKDQSSSDSMFVTRTGHLVAKEGPQVFYATEQLQRGLHPKIENEARPQFLIGKYELGVFAALKAVEIRVRRLGGYADEVVGADLMNKAFGPNGPLKDPSATKGEADGTRALFVGAYGVFRNPVGHREVNYDEVAEAAEAVGTASLLMRILDRVERRLNPPVADVFVAS
jgi:uncharacterized protein (TIGR02391 family)